MESSEGDMIPLRPYHLLLAVGVLLAGCQYQGPGSGNGTPAIDYAFAVGSQNPPLGGGAVGASEAFVEYMLPPQLAGAQLPPGTPTLRTPQDFACGWPSGDGPSVVWGLAANYFFYAEQTAHGIVPGGDRVCLSWGPTSNPLVIQQRSFTTSDFGFSAGEYLDRAFVTVSDNKVALTVDGLYAYQTHALIFSLADLLAGAPPHTTLVRHANIVRYAPAVGNVGALFWLRTGVAASAVTIGRITGIPGVGGGITTASVDVSIAPNGYPLGVVLGSAPWGGTAPTLIIALDTGTDQHAYLTAVTGLSDTLAPRIVAQARMPVPPLAFHSGTYPMPYSLSATPRGNVLFGFTSAGQPYLVSWPFLRAITGPLGLAANWGGLTSTTNPRRDFLPLGAAAPDPSRPGEWQACVGWGDNTVANAVYGGQHAVCLADSQF
jgi:hypothetical protein